MNGNRQCVDRQKRNCPCGKLQRKKLKKKKRKQELHKGQKALYVERKKRNCVKDTTQCIEKKGGAA